MNTSSVSAYQPPANRWLIIIAVMLVAIIEVLDMTIVNVALPPMMGSLSANADQITWVLTSYIVASAVVMLLTGFLVNYFGRRKILLINITGFLAASMLCGIATSLTEIVIFRALQGIFGAALVPLSQFVLRDTFSKEEQGMAMAIWGTGIMAAPVLGPTIGGYITEILNWRWVFYINVPFCLLAFFLTLRVIPETPTQRTTIDWTGMLLMALGVGALQIFLDRGNTEGWFDSTTITLLCAIAVIALSLFIYRGLTYHTPIVKLFLLVNRTFGICTLLMLLYCTGLFGILAAQPIMLESLFHYPVVTAGLVMAPRGIASAIMMMFTGKMLTRFDARWFIFVGILAAAYGAWLMCDLNLEVGFQQMLWPMIMQGVGMGLFFVAVSAVAFRDLPEQYIAEAAGIFSFSRSLGSSIGISAISTIISRTTQMNWDQLAGHISTFNPQLQNWLQQTHMPLNQPTTLPILAQTLANQAQMIAFNNSNWIIAVMLFFIAMLVFLLKPMKLQSGMMLH